MDLKKYQEGARRTAIYPDIGNNLSYPALGLGGESGEVLEHIKKAMRDDDGKLTDERRQELSKEIGDVLWYLANLSEEAELSLADIAEENLAKLASRAERGQLHGSGDNR